MKCHVQAEEKNCSFSDGNRTAKKKKKKKHREKRKLGTDI